MNRLASSSISFPSSPQSRVVLATLNAKYIHASLGLRCLLANLDVHGGAGLRAQTQLREFVIGQPATRIVEDLLALQPEVIGLGIYIWNVVETTQVVRLLKTLRPDIKIVLGGPEVSHEVEQQEICRLADHVVTGWGDVSFPKLCRALLDGPKPLMKVITGEQPALSELALPYQDYTADDLAQRLLYVEASRGCPFKCEFCLSSLDKTAWAFDLDVFMAEMEALYQRGARNFKFVDRTFNLKIDNSVRILQFFLDRLQDTPDVFVHFEVVPDSLPDRLKALIAQFPAGALQFEVGIQSFNPEVQQRISRKQDNSKTADNLRWLVGESQAHVHADLIFGLPGETLDSFAEGFDRLYELAPHEIQFGVLKRLRGTPITRHTTDFAMLYDPQTPYTILQNSTVDFLTMQRVKRFARYWEMVANSGRFALGLKLLLEPGSAFQHFLNFSDWLWQTTGKTHEFAYEKLVDLLFEYLTQIRAVEAPEVCAALLADYQASGARGRPACLAVLLAGLQKTPSLAVEKHRVERQGRHLSQQQSLRGEIQKAAAAA
ncbi:B12-binding domain-containing radical SAM protein [Polaromonas sp. SM01]|uniref:B12-binding domain-containing radical SAM protein n=1 Tax=Polaromonas sp. SM01 TaxID=3085630 RepID=UPI0029818B6C|nr:radical SAM protein [Polaromonas sp. SM01]MDW5444651.1 radical SAM protein [Polaromonas sp. SM01]